MEPLNISERTRIAIIIIASFLLFMMLESCRKEPSVNVKVINVAQDSYFVRGYYDNNNIFVPVPQMADSFHLVPLTTYTDSTGAIHYLDNYPRYGGSGAQINYRITNYSYRTIKEYKITFELHLRGNNPNSIVTVDVDDYGYDLQDYANGSKFVLPFEIDEKEVVDAQVKNYVLF